MSEENANQQPPPAQQAASNASTENNGGSGTQQQGAGQHEDPSNPSWLPDRLKRAQEQAIKSLLTDIGIEKPEDLKALVADVNKQREAQLTEAERLQKERDKFKAEAEAAKALAEQVQQARIQDQVDTALRTAAMQARADHPEDVIVFLRRSAPEEVAKVFVDGKVSETQAKKLIEDVRKVRPNYFLPGGPGSPSNRDGRDRTPDAQGRDALKRASRTNQRIIRG